jgi:hypothetical protein
LAQHESLFRVSRLRRINVAPSLRLGGGRLHQSVRGQKPGSLVSNHGHAPFTVGGSTAPSFALTEQQPLGESPNPGHVQHVWSYASCGKKTGNSSLPPSSSPCRPARRIVKPGGIRTCEQGSQRRHLLPDDQSSGHRARLHLAGRHDSATPIVGIVTGVSDRRRSLPRNWSRNAIAAQAVRIEYRQVLTVQENVRVPAEPRSTGCFGACRQ